MRRTDSLEKTLMLGKIEGGRRRGRQRMTWLDGITDSMDMSLSKLRSWWWTGRPGVLQSMGSQRVGQHWVTLPAATATAKSRQSCPTLGHPHPWDSPGKNNRVGCHVLQCMKMNSESEVTQSCPTLSDPMDCSLPGSPSMGFSRQEYWMGCHCLLCNFA